jgi:hypothetical protein
VAGHNARMEDIKNTYEILVGRSEGKSPFETSRRRSQNNIIMDLREIG